MKNKNLIGSTRLLIFSLSVIWFSGCTAKREPAEERRVFRYNEAADISTLDPAFARDQANIWAVNQIYNGLVQLDDHLSVVPCIARSWKISTSGTEYTFYLRNDVYFHDSPCFAGGSGRRVTAHDFEYSLNRLSDRVIAAPGAWILNYCDEVRPVETVDDTTLVIRLKRPFPPFLGILSMQYASVIPHEAIEKFGSDFRSNPVGTGPFRLGMWKEGVKLVLTKNPNYFETENGARLPYLDAVSITFLPDKQSAFLEFIKGKLDFLSGIDPAYKDELLTKSGELNPKYSDRVTLLKSPYLNTEYFAILMDPDANDGSDQNPLRNREVRKAINYAFDRVKMIRYLRNNIGFPGVFGIVPPGVPGADTSAPHYEYNPAKAKDLLDKAGYPGGKGLPELVLTTTSDYIDICKFIQFQLAEQGITLRIEISPPAAMREMRAQAKLPFFRASWIADYPDAESYLSLFITENHTPAGPNYTRFKNREFDELYHSAMSMTNDTLRYEQYREMQQIIMRESPVIILYYDEVLTFVRKEVSGLGINPMNLLTLKRVRKS